MNFSELGEKMFAIFDKDGSGRVSQEEIIDQVTSLSVMNECIGIARQSHDDPESVAFFPLRIDTLLRR